MTMGPTPTGIGPRGGSRAGWGISNPGFGSVGFGEVLTLRQAQYRVRNLRLAVRKKAHEMLEAAAEPLRAQWRENIAAMGWTGTSGFELLDEDDQDRSNLRDDDDGSASSGRYYNSIAIEVDSALEVHVGSTIPRPSGRGLTTWSYPEALEFGTSVAPAYPTLRPALDQAGPAMESKSREVFEALAAGYLSGKYRAL